MIKIIMIPKYRPEDGLRNMIYLEVIDRAPPFRRPE